MFWCVFYLRRNVLIYFFDMFWICFGYALGMFWRVLCLRWYVLVSVLYVLGMFFVCFRYVLACVVSALVCFGMCFICFGYV